MKKINLSRLLALFLLIGLMSCSKKSPQLTIDKKNSVQGNLKEYVEIVDQSPYKIEFGKVRGDLKPYIVLKLKAIKPFTIPINDINQFMFVLDISDENAVNIVPGNFTANSYDDGIVEFLKQGSGEKILKFQY